VALSYDLLARVYDRLYSQEQAAKIRVVLELQPPLEPVLDVGCGTGLLLERLLCYCVGLDLSLGMLKAAKARGRVRHGDLVCGDAEQMPFRDSSLRTVYSVTVLHEAPLALDEILRVLKQEGRAAVTLLRKRIELLPKLLEKLNGAEVYDEPDLKDVVIIFKGRGDRSE